MRLLPMLRGSSPAGGLKRVCLATLAFLLIFVANLPPAGAEQENLSATARVRIGIVKDGITVVTPGDLLSAGIDTASVDPRTFAMSSMGKPVAIYVTGEADGRFDPEDSLYFFGEKFRGPEMDQKYTDERVYWLDMGGTGGPRVSTADATPQFNLTPPADFATTLRAEESMIWWTLHSLTVDTQDTWFWGRLQAPLVPSAALSYMVPYPSSAAAGLRLEQISNSFVYGSGPDHHTTAALNGVPVIDQTWESPAVRKRQVLSGAVPAGVLTHGVNTLNVSSLLVPGAYGDDIYVNYWELDYRRQFRAWEDRLDFRTDTSGPQEYVVDGFSDSRVWIWNVTQSGAPVRLNLSPATPGNMKLYLPLIAGSTSPGGQAATVRFRVNTAAEHRYWLQSASTLQGPASIRLRPPSDLRNPAGGADAVIVTSAELRPQAERLAEWHRTSGRRALVVDIQDAYDEFNEGIYHPKAVQAMMAWASANWTGPAPAYLTLLGDGHWNFKNYNLAVYPGGPNHIPPYLAWVDPWQGEVPADGRYGDVNSDTLPDIAVGRIAVESAAQAATVVDKIASYDENVRAAAWQRQAIFVADNPDEAGDFPAVSDQVILANTPSDLQATRVYLPGNPPLTPATPDEVAATKAALLNAITAGAFMVQYTGHGAPERWTGESLLTKGDITSANMANGSRLPVVLTFNCLDGYFAHADPTRVSIAESMQRLAGGGSIAAISPSGLGTTDAQLAFRRILLDVMFKDNVHELGTALTITKQRFSQVYGSHYLTQTMMLYGDPALRLPAAQ